MTKRALIDIRDNTIIQVEPQGGDFLVSTDYAWVDCPDDVVAYSYTYDGANFNEPPPPPPPPEPPTPTVVSMRQARLALLGAGLLSSVNAAIAAMAGVEGEAARIEWEYAQEVRRDSALVAGMAGALSLTEEQLDALFLMGASL